MPVFYQDPKMENGAVFTANVVRNDDVYVSDKTMAEILKAYDDGKFVIFDVNDSGYHFIFTEGTIALTNRTPYQGVFIFGNAMASFSADNATTVNNVDYFNMTLESSGDTLPEITDTDEGKVLTAKDGEAVWEDAPESTPIEVYDSLDSVPDDLPDGSFVIIPSEDSGESDTSGGTSGGGLLRLTINTTGQYGDDSLEKDSIVLTDEQIAFLDNIKNNPKIFECEINFISYGPNGTSVMDNIHQVLPYCTFYDGITFFAAPGGALDPSMSIMFMNADSLWTAMWMEG